jgi:hypothetical protein
MLVSNDFHEQKQPCALVTPLPELNKTNGDGTMNLTGTRGIPGPRDNGLMHQLGAPRTGRPSLRHHQIKAGGNSSYCVQAKYGQIES